MRAALTEWGHDVLSALERDPKASDEALLALALEDGRALITEDKDFGELVFRHRLPHPCIIRLVDLRGDEKAAAIRALVENHHEALTEGALVVVTPSRVRIRFRER